MIGAGTFYLNEPLALETVAAAVGHHEVQILDMRLDERLDETLYALQPQVVGITAYTPDVYTVHGLLQRIKAFDRHILTVVGGHHATFFPQDFNTPHVDTVVLGEGEFAFRALVDTYGRGESILSIPGIAVRSGGDLHFTPTRPAEVLDDTPLPARHLTASYRARYFRGKWRPVASIITSRGCPYRCNFCSVWKRENGRYRVESPERVVRELENIDEHCVSIGDDNFLHDVRRAERIYELIKERGINKVYKLVGRTDTVVRHPEIIAQWKEIGMEQIFLGLESFRDKDLHRLNKTTSLETNNRAIEILHGYGVDVVGQFIIDPDYEKEDFDALVHYVREMRLNEPIFSVLTPLPGTDLYEARKNDLLTHNYEMFDLVHSVLPTRLPREEFYRHYADLFVRCYGGRGEGSDVNASVIPGSIIDKLYSQLVNAHTLY
jgi:radical SAM superfamily enzyme YgiQ (UPF0313 family)